MEREQATRKKRKKPNNSAKRKAADRRSSDRQYDENRKKKPSTNQKRRKKKVAQESNRKKRRPNQEYIQNKQRPKPSQKQLTPFDTKVKPMIKSVLNVAFYVFIMVVVFTAIMFSFNDDQTKSFFGYRIMTVKTNSMAPKKDTTFKDGFKVGAMIILKKEDKNNLKKDEIITYMPTLGRESAYLTHRIVDVLDELEGVPGKYYVTQGDFNDVADSPFTPDHYMGTVIYSIPHLGVVIQFIQNNIFVVLLLGLAVFCFYVTLRYYLSMPN